MNRFAATHGGIHTTGDAVTARSTSRFVHLRGHPVCGDRGAVLGSHRADPLDASWYDGNFRFSSLWEPHNQTRPLVYRFVMLAMLGI